MVTATVMAILTAFLLFVLLFNIILSKIMQKRRVKKRIQAIERAREEEEQEKEVQVRVRWTSQATEGLNQIGPIAKWQELLKRGNIMMSAGEFYLLRIMCSILILLILMLTGVYWIFYSVAIIVFWLPVAWLKRKVDQRMHRASEQLSEALGTMANSMRAGFSFMQAVKLIAEEYPDPLGPEFQKTLKDIQYGVSIDEAFQQLTSRLPDKELDMTVKAMMIQRTAGGNLAELFETIQETVMGRLQIKDEVRTLTTQGRMSTWIITAIPVALAVYLAVFSDDYFQLLYTHPLGIFLIVLGIFGIVIGWFSLRKIARIEV